jgi:hypothetical protein
VCLGQTVFRVVDNRSFGVAAIRRLAKDWPRTHLIRTPFHSWWLNQVQIYVLICQRKVLTLNDLPISPPSSSACSPSSAAAADR